MGNAFDICYCLGVSGTFTLLGWVNKLGWLAFCMFLFAILNKLVLGGGIDGVVGGWAVLVVLVVGLVY